MRIADKTKEQLVEDLKSLRLRVTELEQTEAGHRRREEAIGKLDEEKLSVLNSMSEHVVYQNPQHRILWANKAAAEAAGLAREHLVGCYCYEVLSECREPCVDCPVAKARETGKPQESEVTTPDGRVWLIKGYPIRDTDDHIVALVEVALEVTERKQVEEALRKGERKFELLFESTLDGMFVLDAETMKVVLANQAAVDIYGLNSVEEAIGLNLLDCVPPGERERVLRLVVKDMFENDLRQVSEFRGITKDGRKIWLSVVGTRTEYRGKLAGLISFSDITERKQAEEVLQTEKNKLQSVIDALEYGLTIQDRDYNILYQSGPLKKFFGEHLGEKCYQAYESRDTICDDCPVKKAFKDGKSHSAVKDGATPSGEVFIMERTACPIRDAEGKIVSCLEITRDITERKQAEEALRESKEFNASLLENSPNPVVVINPDTSIRYVNPALEKLTGFKSKEVIGIKQPFPWWIDNKTQETMDRIRNGLSKRGQAREEVLFQKKNGERFWVNVNAVLVRRNDEPSYTLVNWVNVTERKRAEEALQAEKNKLQSVIDAIEDGLSIQDRDYNILYQSAPSTRTGGYHVGEKCYQAYEGRDTVCDDCPMEQAFKDGKSHTSERELVTLSGEVLSLENTANPIKDAEGEIVSCLEVTRNITERKAAEEELKLRAQILDGATDAIFVHDDDDNFVYVNEAACRTHGYSRKEFMKMKLPQIVDPERARPLKLDRQELLKKGHIVTESAHVRKDGSIMPVEVHARTIGSGEGKLFLTVARDITERKQAEDAVRESEEKLRKMFESVTDGISVIDLNGLITDVNQRTVEMHGFSSKDEILGKSALELIAPVDHERVATNMRKALTQGIIRGMEYTLLKADGSEFPGELSTSVLKDAAGNAVGHITISRDITKRKEAEELYSTLANSSPIGVYILQDGKFRFVNPQFQKYTGFSEDELLGRESLEVVHPEDRERVREDAVDMLKGRRLSPYELRYIVKSGEILWATETVTSIQYRGKRAVLGNFMDVTEHKRAEEAFERQRAYFQQLFDNSPEAIVLLDTNNRIVNINKGFEILFGYAIEEVKGQPLSKVIVPGDRNKEAASLAQSMHNNETRREESVRERKDGSLVDVALLAYPIWSGDKAVGAYVIYTDITERKHAEEEKKEMEQKAHLASRLASVGEMASGIAHEINNPLTSVIGFSQLLMEGDIPDDVKEDVSIIYKEAQRAAGVAKNLLTFARKQAPAKQPTNINTIIDGVLKLRAYEQRVNNIQVDSQLAPDLPEVMADYSQLQQVFINIIINAESAMIEANKGGTLTITTQKVNKTVRASFSDDGPGITRENLNRIFDPFFTTKEVGKGTGLGLSVCHGIVAEHGGRLYARSKPDKGATFIVDLPVNNS